MEAKTVDKNRIHIYVCGSAFSTHNVKFWFANNASRTTTVTTPDEKITTEPIVKGKSSEYIIP
ncbi:MAG: hypothetical protein A2481_02600 [Candidatus Yonathbacteria bacterium RIFOXYC2_FULL_47_9]|nr:MAG: hypothetical protein A2481_02600 [Candidatus Yonathbacteria bacterium RIFOXYC2_FULL_47_9]HAT68589.1 hypothetical protein [Candidatus Yonathbacteria bacterium]